MRKSLICVLLILASIVASPGVASYAEPSTPDSLAQTDTDNIQKLLQQAYGAYFFKNYQDAEIIYRQILKLDPDLPTKALVYHALATIQRIQGNLSEAIELYQNSLQANSNFFISHVDLGIAQYEIGETKEAWISLQKAEKLLPKRVESLEDLSYYTTLSYGLDRIDRFTESIKVIRQAISLNPYVANGAHCQLMSEAFRPLGIYVRLNLRQYRSARCELDFYLAKDLINPFERAIEQSKYAEVYQKVGLNEFIFVPPRQLFQPDYPNDRLNLAYSITHLNLGISLFNRAMITDDSTSMKEAIASFRTSIKYDANHSWTYLYLGIALLAEGQWSEAIDVTEKALQLSNAEAIYGSPTNSHSWAHNIIGYAYQLQGDSNAAIAQYQKAIELDRTFTSAQNNLQELI